MYEPQYEEGQGGGGFVLGLICGAALGAAIGLMLAPKAGAEMRQTLVDSTADIRKKATDAYGQASQTVNEMVSKGREAVDRGRQAFDSARQSATEGNFGQSRQNASDFGSGPRPSSQAGV